MATATMRLVSAQESPIAQCGATGSIHFDKVLIIVLYLNDNTTLIPLFGKSSTLVLDHD